MSGRVSSGSARLFVTLALLASGAGAAAAETVPRHECFPFEQLEPSLRAQAERLLLTAMDREALFTIIGGMKPVSSGFGTFEVEVQAPSTTAIDEARKMMAAWRCGDVFYAGVVPFAKVYDGKRPLQALVAHRPALSAMVARHPAFFGALGVTPSSHPLEVVLTVEHEAQAVRYRGYGRLFGYPEDAVTFFVDASVSQERDGRLVPRDFRSIPTFESAAYRFVYAIPKGAPRSAEDEAIAARAARILQAYRERRSRFVGDGRPGVVELLRDWFDVGNGRCDPVVAERRILDADALLQPGP